MDGFDVITMGRIGVDVYPLQSGVSLREVETFGKFLGGSPTNVAVAAARYGRRTAVITRTGEDPFGEFLHDALRRFGVDDRYVTGVPHLPTPVTFCEILPPDDFPLYFYREWSTAVDEREPRAAAAAARELGIDLVVVKQGPKGVLAIGGRDAVELPPVPVDVVNGLGAGDAFGGALCHGLLAGWELERLMRFCNAAGDVGDDELIVLPLAGGCSVSCDEETFQLEGRDGVFTGVTDFAYVPRDARVELASAQGGRFALPSARAGRRLEPRHVAARDVPVELRGAGRASRQVNNFCSPEAFEADRLIAVEVLTPSGNWSSYPPHKHDEEIPGVETALEEIYYFEVARGGFGYQRAYGPGIDVCREIRTGDTVLLPSGYHGPSMAAPGYDLYYLNVMAGPGERAWRFTDDPAHAWIRDTWAGQEMDSRLPMSAPTGRHA